MFVISIELLLTTVVFMQQHLIIVEMNMMSREREGTFPGKMEIEKGTKK
jgi:hypothetical protein